MKTWERTRLQNLGRHKSGRYYARAFARGKVQGRLGRLAVSSAGKQWASNDCMPLLISDRHVLFQTEFPVSFGVREQRTD
jgi:hypothetical protein